MPKSRRTGGRYDGDDVARLRFIRRARELGFTPDEVRALLDLSGPGKASCAEVRTIAARHLEEVRSKIADPRKLERLLAKIIAKCSGRKVPDYPVIDILDT
jgi:MerR family mercuric resistance operon transcriptional regulator